jgi:hypothetical protein
MGKKTIKNPWMAVAVAAVLGVGSSFRRAVAKESKHTAGLPGHMQRNSTLLWRLPLRDSQRNHRWVRQRSWAG